MTLKQLGELRDVLSLLKGTLAGKWKDGEITVDLVEGKTYVQINIHLAKG